MRVALAVLALVVILSFFLAPWVAITPTDFLPDTIQRVLAIADVGLAQAGARARPRPVGTIGDRHHPPAFQDAADRVSEPLDVDRDPGALLVAAGITLAAGALELGIGF